MTWNWLPFLFCLANEKKSQTVTHSVLYFQQIPVLAPSLSLDTRLLKLSPLPALSARCNEARRPSTCLVYLRPLTSFLLTELCCEVEEQRGEHWLDPV